MTPYSWEVHVFYAFGGLPGLRRGTGHFGCGVDGGVAHYTFEAVVGVGLLEFSEAVC